MDTFGARDARGGIQRNRSERTHQDRTETNAPRVAKRVATPIVSESISKKGVLHIQDHHHFRRERGINYKRANASTFW